MGDHFDHLAQAGVPPPPHAMGRWDTPLAIVRGLLNVPAAIQMGLFGDGAAVWFGTSLAAPVAGILSPIGAALIGLYFISRADEQGDLLGNHNAFLAAFAESVSDFSRGCDQRRRNVVYQDASVQGRNAAIHVLKAVGPDARNKLFRHYRAMGDVEAVREIVKRLKGYRTQ